VNNTERQLEKNAFENYVSKSTPKIYVSTHADNEYICTLGSKGVRSLSWSLYLCNH
jgi:hypothetical protein